LYAVADLEFLGGEARRYFVWRRRGKIFEVFSPGIHSNIATGIMEKIFEVFSPATFLLESRVKKPTFVLLKNRV
jgi:hypothetical protein